jgi:hypothetical protein
LKFKCDNIVFKYARLKYYFSDVYCSPQGRLRYFGAAPAKLLTFLGNVIMCTVAKRIIPRLSINKYNPQTQRPQLNP